MADQTLYNKWDLPLSHERNLEAFLRLRLVDIDAALGNEFISGLRLDYAGNNDLTVQPGVAYVQGVERVRLSIPIALTGPTLTANTWLDTVNLRGALNEPGYARGYLTDFNSLTLSGSPCHI